VTGAAVTAVDIGGTKIAAAVVDAEGRYTAGPFTLPSGRTTSGRELADRVHELIARCRGHGGDHRIGVAAAGPFAAPGRLSPVNLDGWDDFPLADEIAERNPDADISMINDGVAMAMAEFWLGAAHGARSSIGIVTSTGVGGGVVVDGRPLLGATGNAGHIGHIIVEPGGLVCPCGARGCAETVASGTAAVRYARESGWRPSGEADGRALAADARRGVAPAVAAFERAARGLALALIGALAVTDVEMVTVGGGFAEAGALLFDPLHAALGDLAGLEFIRRVPVVPAVLGAEASLTGAAATFYTVGA
jgi:glucokinase